MLRGGTSRSQAWTPIAQGRPPPESVGGDRRSWNSRAASTSPARRRPKAPSASKKILCLRKIWFEVWVSEWVKSVLSESKICFVLLCIVVTANERDIYIERAEEGEWGESVCVNVRERERDRWREGCESRENVWQRTKKTGVWRLIGTHGVVISILFQIQTKQRGCASHLPLFFLPTRIIAFSFLFSSAHIPECGGVIHLYVVIMYHTCDEMHRSHTLFTYLLTWIFNINMTLLTWTNQFLKNIKHGVRN